MCEIDKDRVIVGGNDTLSIVNIDKCEIEKTIKDDSFENFTSLLKLRDNKAILCGGKAGNFLFFDMKKDEYKITKKNHNDCVYDLLLIDDNTFVSCSGDSIIKVWKFN